MPHYDAFGLFTLSGHCTASIKFGLQVGCCQCEDLSTTGWIAVILLLLLFWPLFWIPFVMPECYEVKRMSARLVLCDSYQAHHGAFSPQRYQHLLLAVKHCCHVLGVIACSWLVHLMKSAIVRQCRDIRFQSMGQQEHQCSMLEQSTLAIPLRILCDASACSTIHSAGLAKQSAHDSQQMGKYSLLKANIVSIDSKACTESNSYRQTRIRSLEGSMAFHL